MNHTPRYFWPIALLIFLAGACFANSPSTLVNFSTAVPKVQPGSGFRINYEWMAQPTDVPCTIFVHFRDNKGIVLQGDHTPNWPLATTNWTGKVTYSQRVFVPADFPEGNYAIRVGLYDPVTKKKYPLNPGAGMRCLNDLSLDVGTIEVAQNGPAEVPDNGRPSAIDFSKMKETFRDDFDDLDVSSRGSFTRWTAHTPNAKDFGDAIFTDPRPGFPFSVKDGILSIIAKKFNPRWRSGLLCSVDVSGDGFSQKFGYFEVRAKLPEGAGTWPAFWLLPVKTLDDPNQPGVEIDIFEQYGRDPFGLHFSLHLRRPGEPTQTATTCVRVRDTNREFHTYGFFWDEKTMIWFYDGQEMWRIPTPPEAFSPKYLLINLAMGGGWKVCSKMHSAIFYLDYVKVLSFYEKRSRYLSD